MKTVEMLARELGNNVDDDGDRVRQSDVKRDCQHCCEAHCNLFGHHGGKASPTLAVEQVKFDLAGLSLPPVVEEEDYVLDNAAGIHTDTFLGMMCGLGMDFQLQ